MYASPFIPFIVCALIFANATISNPVPSALIVTLWIIPLPVSDTSAVVSLRATTSFKNPATPSTGNEDTTS